MKTSSYQSFKALATVLSCFIICIGCVDAAPKGAELLMQRSMNSGTGVAVQSPPKPSSMESPTTTTELHTYDVKVVTDNEECALVFEAMLRDATDFVVGVTRHTSEDLHETRLTVSTSLSNLAQLKSAFEATLKRVSKTGLLQQSTVVDTAQMSFAAITIVEEDGGLAVRIPQSALQAKATSLVPAPEPATAASVASSLLPFPNSKNTTQNATASHPSNKHDEHGSTELVGVTQKNADGQTPTLARPINGMSPKRSNTGLAALVVVVLLIGFVGLWVSLRAVLRVFICAYRQVTRHG